MIYRPIKFDVIYKNDGKFVREEVRELFMPPQSAANLATTITGIEVSLEDVMNVSLLQFTGEFDKDGKPVFQAHILSDDEGNLSEVIFFGGAFHLLFAGADQPSPLSNENCAKLRIIGDSIQNANLLLPDKPEEAFEASAQRKI